MGVTGDQTKNHQIRRIFQTVKEIHASPVVKWPELGSVWHNALRKHCESKEARACYEAWRDMPGKERKDVLLAVREYIEATRSNS